MVRSGEHLAEVHGVLFQQERRVQIDLTLTRGVRNTTKKMLVNGQRPHSRASVSEVLPLTVFTPEGVDIVRQGPEQRRTYLTNLLTDVDLSTGDVIERFTRVLSQRNAVLRSFQGESPTPGQRDELGVWDVEFCEASERLIEVRLQLLERLAPLIRDFYRAIAQNDRSVSAHYERSWTGDLSTALRNALKDDQHRGHSTVGPQRDDIVLLLDSRDARRQASQGEQRCWRWRYVSQDTIWFAKNGVWTHCSCWMTSLVNSTRHEVTGSSTCCQPVKPSSRQRHHCPAG
jgi:DNA replication and repair protein RecF